MHVVMLVQRACHSLRRVSGSCQRGSCVGKKLAIMNVLKAYKKDDEDSKRVYQLPLFRINLNQCSAGGGNPFTHLEKTTVLQEVRLGVPNVVIGTLFHYVIWCRLALSMTTLSMRGSVPLFSRKFSISSTM